MITEQKNEKIKMRVERINPYLNVSDIPTAIRYYVEVLGFDLYIETPNLGIVTRDGHQIHLIESQDTVSAHRVWLGVDDVDSLFEQLKARGVIIYQEPANYPWAYQMIIGDPDGNRLIYGSAPRDDKPFQDSLHH